MNPPGPQAAPAVQVLGASLLLRGSAVMNTQRAVRSLIAAHRREGIAPPPEIAALLRACDDAARELLAMSGTGQRDTTSVAVQPHSDLDNIGTREVAKILRISQRQAQRLTATLDARQLASRQWMFDRTAVLAYQQAQRESGRAA